MAEITVEQKKKILKEGSTPIPKRKELSRFIRSQYIKKMRRISNKYPGQKTDPEIKQRNKAAREDAPEEEKYGEEKYKSGNQMTKYDAGERYASIKRKGLKKGYQDRLREAVQVVSKIYKDMDKCEPIFVVEKARKYIAIAVGDNKEPKPEYEYCLKLKQYEGDERSLHLGYFDSEAKAEALGKKILKAIHDAKKS